MKGVVAYLKDNPKLIQCDFRAFKTEVHDISTLTDYLKERNCSVKGIAINRKIEAEVACVKASKPNFKIVPYD